MTKDKYREALTAVMKEYECLSEQRAAIDARLAQLVQAIGSLSHLCDLRPTVALGLTDACRIVLKAVDHPLAAAEIRQQLEVMGYDTSRYSNPLGSIHVVLRRLCRSGEATFVPRKFGKPAYAWNRPPKIGMVHKGADLSKLRF